MKRIIPIAVFLLLIVVGMSIIIPRDEPMVGVSESPAITHSPVSSTSSPTRTQTIVPSAPEPSPSMILANWSEISWANRSKQQVVFTFDGGAGSQSIEEILATLKKQGVKATFFLTGKWAEQNSAFVRLMSAEGHEVFNHTYSHTDLTTLSSSEIASEFLRTENIIKNFTGATTKPYFRPPYGARNAAVLAAARDAGYRSVYWTVDALDWKEGITDEEVRNRILNNLKPGTIYMMHIGDDITGRILDEVLAEIKNRGYTIRSLTEAL